MTGDIMLFFTKIKLKNHVGKGCRYFHKPALICLRRKQRHQMLAASISISPTVFGLEIKTVVFGLGIKMSRQVDEIAPTPNF